MSPAVPATTEPIFLAREPMLDRQQLLAGYQLDFRLADGAAPATAETIAQSFATLGLGQSLSGCHAFVRVDGQALMHAAIEALPQALAVLQLDVRLLDDAALRARAEMLHTQGYAFCLENLDRQTPLSDAAVALASYFKFDLAQVPADDLQALSSLLRGPRRTLIAAGVATPAHFELCALLGAELFQGYFFAQPDERNAGKPLDASTQAIFRLIGQLGGDAEIDELDATLRAEPALIVQLLRLTNSVGVGARSRISSVRHAIAVLGRRQLLRWLQLLLFRSQGRGDLGANALMQYAALRGRFMELLATRLYPGQARLTDPAFITGLVSVLPAALGLAMREILVQLPVEDQISLALLHREGELGMLLALLDAYDANDAAAVSAALQPYPSADTGLLAEILAEALSWVQALQQEQV